MNEEILKKIDEEIERLKERDNGVGTYSIPYAIKELYKVKDIIKSALDAKETNVPTTDSNKPSQDLNKVSQEHDACDGCKYEELDESVYPCCDCKQNYMDLYKRKPVKTRGDAIRESNESLAEFIDDYASCDHCIYTTIEGDCCRECIEGILAYLNQPESEEK